MSQYGWRVQVQNGRTAHLLADVHFSTGGAVARNPKLPGIWRDIVTTPDFSCDVEGRDAKDFVSSDAWWAASKDLCY